MTPVELYRAMTAQGLSVSQDLLDALVCSGLYEDKIEGVRAILSEDAGQLEGGFQKDRRRARLSLAWDRVMEQVEMHRDRPDWVDALPDFDGEVVVDGENSVANLKTWPPLGKNTKCTRHLKEKRRETLLLSATMNLLSSNLGLMIRDVDGELF